LLEARRGRAARLGEAGAGPVVSGEPPNR